MELRRNPTARSAVSGATVAGALHVLGASKEYSAVAGIATTVISRTVRGHLRNLERQASLAGDMSLMSAWLGPDMPVLGGWSILADFAALIGRELEGGPETVVELGAGASTLLIASRLRRNGRGRLYTVEHDERYASRVAESLDRAGVRDQVTVVNAPLRRQRIGTREVEWYERSKVEEGLETPIDLLVVDGPPAGGPRSRWPALPVLHPGLAFGAAVLADDGRRRDETRAAFSWRADFPDLDLRWEDTIRGTWVLRKRSRPRQEPWSIRAWRGLARTLNRHPQLSSPR